MWGYFNNLSSSTKKILNGLISIVSIFLLIYVVNKSNYYSAVYNELGKNIFKFACEINLFTFMLTILIFLVSIMQLGYSMYIYGTIFFCGDERWYDKIVTVLYFIINIIGIWLGTIGIKSYLKLFLLLIFMSIVFWGFMGAAVRNES